MRSEHWTDRLSDYLDGEMSTEDVRRLEAHLAACGDCAATLDDLRAVVSAAGSLPDRPPERDLWPGVESRLTPRSADRSLAAGPELSLLEARERRRRVALTVPQLAAAAVVLVLLSGTTVWLALGRSPAPDPVVATRTAPPEAAVSLTASYDAAIAELEREFDRRRPALDPATLLVVERNLAIIDEAIAEARRALDGDPQSGFLHEYVEETMRRKVHLLRQANDIPRTNS